jgi:putative GTP pyrophosphokinase
MTSGWPTPQFTRTRVRAAGKRIREDEGIDEDWVVLENWRRSHAYVLNLFQLRLRHTRKRFGGEVQVAQRHKRRPTIVDKLKREPTMQLPSMHDIAGCRAIFASIDELQDFRRRFLDTRAKHVHVNRDSTHYDYISQPKPSGYRGIHDVFEMQIQSKSGSRWNGLKVEVQFRTRAQHAWATAVETVDLLSGERAKFGQANPKLQRFFLVTSEMIARVHEGRKGFLRDMGDRDVGSEFSRLDHELGIVTRLSQAAARNPTIHKGRHTLLVFHFDGRGLEVRSFESIGPAQEAYSELEQSLGDAADVVLVHGQHAEDLRRAFQNYFTDAGDFLGLVAEARKGLS